MTDGRSDADAATPEYAAAYARHFVDALTGIATGALGHTFRSMPSYAVNDSDLAFAYAYQSVSKQPPPSWRGLVANATLVEKTLQTTRASLLAERYGYDVLYAQRYAQLRMEGVGMEQATDYAATYANAMESGFTDTKANHEALDTVKGIRKRGMCCSACAIALALLIVFAVYGLFQAL